MLAIGNKLVVNLYLGNRNITKIYKGNHIVWGKKK